MNNRGEVSQSSSAPVLAATNKCARPNVGASSHNPKANPDFEGFNAGLPVTYSDTSESDVEVSCFVPSSNYFSLSLYPVCI